MQKTKQKGYMQLTLAMTFVGSGIVAARSLANTPIFLVNSIRFLIAAITLLPLLIRKLPELKQIRRKDMMRLALSALSGVFLFNVLLFWGLRYIGAGTSGIITSFTPIVTTILSVIYLKERMARKKMIASFAASAGLVCIAVCSSQPGAGGKTTLLGSCLIFGVVLCDASFTLLAKSVNRRVSPDVMALIVVYCSGILFLPPGVWQAAHFPLHLLTVKDWLLILYLGTIVNAVAYIIWYAGLKKVSANQAAVFTGIIPVSSLLLAAMTLKEHVTLLQVAGLVLVLGGVMLVTQSPRSRVVPPEYTPEPVD